MIPRGSKIFGFTLALACLLACGCNRAGTPPAPLAVEQIPVEFQKGFAQAKPEVKALSDQLLTLLQSKDYPAAFQLIQGLVSLPNLTKDQRLLASRAMLTLYQLLQAAQSQGDQNAATALRVYKSSK